MEVGAVVVVVVPVVAVAVLKNPVPCNEMASGRAERAHRLAAPFVSVTDRYRYGRPDLLLIKQRQRNGEREMVSRASY